MDNFLLLYKFMMYVGDSMEGLIPTPRNLQIQRICLEIDSLLLNCLPRKPSARRIPSLKEENLLIVENVYFLLALSASLPA